MDDETLLFDWIRHYGSLLVLLTVAGCVLAGGLLVMTPRPFEAWSVVIQTGDQIPPVQLGPASQAIFRSEAVYGPAMRELGIQESPERFLRERAELRPVPETNALIIIGRAGDPASATSIADAMTDSFISGLRARALAQFTRFGRTAPVRRGPAASAALALGAAVGFWVALGVAVVHFRVKRPVLSLSRALAIAPSDQITVLEGTGRPWLGILRRLRSWKRTAGNLSALTGLRTGSPDGRPPSLTFAGGGAVASGPGLSLPRGRRSGEQSRTDDSGVSGRPVIVAHPGTGERSLTEARARTDRLDWSGPAELLWLR